MYSEQGAPTKSSLCARAVNVSTKKTKPTETSQLRQKMEDKPPTPLAPPTLPQPFPYLPPSGGPPSGWPFGPVFAQAQPPLRPGGLPGNFYTTPVLPQEPHLFPG